jgi:predicted nucleotidyltransferase
MSALETIIEPHHGELIQLCRSFGVARLELFGSAATAEFDAPRSDIDFLIEFLPGQDLGPWLSHYFELRSRLAALLGRSVDLVLSTAVRSPDFARELDRTRRLLYAA